MAKAAAVVLAVLAPLTTMLRSEEQSRLPVPPGAQSTTERQSPPRTVDVPSGEHVVSPDLLRQKTVEASRLRQARLETVRKFFSSGPAGKALRQARMEPSKIQSALPMLSQDELAKLSAKIDKLQADFAAGA
ncbi:MAG: hypothetical protein FJW37_08350, partial [Acidobacteria bacterium]|nr:hypothetical protein [Acidobacteriota bacterium]